MAAVQDAVRADAADGRPAGAGEAAQVAAVAGAVGECDLEGDILADAPTDASYRVFARGERFLRVGADYFRRNEIWRTVIDRRTGTTLREERLRENVALVKYVPTGGQVLDVVPLGDTRAG
jgi:vancomycin resistance protein VanW